MISFFEASMKQLSVHHTGNKLLEEYYKLSNKPLDLSDELSKNLFMAYFLKPFEKTTEVYRFYHPSGNLGLNEVYESVKRIFDGDWLFHETSQILAKLLYDTANHPKIKSGELFIAHFEKVQIEGEQLDAIGIFKSENKETFLKIHPKGDGFDSSYEQDGININKLDKGCIIFKTEKEQGYKVVVIDNGKINSAIYWKDEFLQLSIRNDAHNQTANFLSIFKNFVVHKIDDEFEISKAGKIDLLNLAIKYFKEKETFNLEEFNHEVINNVTGIEVFQNYFNNYKEEYELEVAENFDISDSAVKKSARAYKGIVKLDKNFQIQISGNKEMIEKGYDDEKSMNFYKVYFREES